MSRLVYDDSGDAFIERVCHWCDDYCGGECIAIDCTGCGDRLPADESEHITHGDLVLCAECADAFDDAAEQHTWLTSVIKHAVAASTAHVGETVGHNGQRVLVGPTLIAREIDVYPRRGGSGVFEVFNDGSLVAVANETEARLLCAEVGEAS